MCSKLKYITDSTANITFFNISKLKILRENNKPILFIDTCQ